ncbi:MAG: cytochrome c oxidase assembly protein, partial [Betaproteobacteria bacterium]|nr:cytochrome c oxidase assembly protein [Betaproteobacteria bacterium]
MSGAGWGAPAWTGWLLGVAAVWLAYGWLALRRGWAPWRMVVFTLGCAATLVSAWGLHDPLQSMTGYTAALMLLGQGVSPLLLLGLPRPVREAWRDARHAWWASWLLDPWVAVSVFTLLTLALNLPGVFDSALSNAVFSAPIGVLLLLGGLMMWAQ